MRLLFLRKEEFLMQVSEKCKELLQEFNVSESEEEEKTDSRWDELQKLLDNE